MYLSRLKEGILFYLFFMQTKITTVGLLLTRRGILLVGFLIRVVNSGITRKIGSFPKRATFEATERYIENWINLSYREMKNFHLGV